MLHDNKSADSCGRSLSNRLLKNYSNPQAGMVREGMRGDDQQQNHIFSYVSPEERVRKDHPLRAIRAMVDEVLKRLSRRFDSMYAKVGRPSIPPEQLLRAQLLQLLYSIRSERLLMEEIDYSMLFRWFVGLNLDDGVWDATVFTKNAIACWKPMWPRSFWRAWSSRRGRRA